MILRVLIGIGIIYLSMNLFALLVANRLLFVPQNPSYDRLPNEVSIISGNNEQITAVFLENPKAEHTILFSHGNAEDLGNVVPFMRQYYLLGYSVLMYDYRGYGSSEGSPSERKVKQDITAAYRWLVDEKQVPPESIIAHGRSLGGAPATWLAAHHIVGGLVIESTFTSAFRVKTRIPLLPWDRFNSLREMKRIECPVLIIHGKDDEILPFWHARKLYAAAPDGKKMHLWIEGGQHNNYAYVAGSDYLRTFQNFMKKYLKAD